jgi:hypothetical protein
LDDAASLEHVDPRILGHDRAQLADEAAPGGRPAGVHDPATRVAALESERQMPVPVGVEADPEAVEGGDRSRRLLAQDARRGLAHRVAAGHDRVPQVELGAVVGRHRGRQPALRPPA